MEINANFNNVKVGETVCYFSGYLPFAREEKNPTNDEFTDEAKIIQTIASSIYNRSTALECSGEFELKQIRLAPFYYHYLAKRVKSLRR